MISILNKISNSKKSIIIILAVLVIAISFETFQQMYYLKRYNLATDVNFFDLLKTQTLNWSVWILLSSILVYYVNKNSLNRKPNTAFFIKHSILILSLVFLSIFIISLIRLVFSDETFTVNILIKEYVQFFVFQKAPIYTLGYITITIILHLFFINEQLQIEVQELSDLKNSNTSLYKELSSSISDKASILNIKIGNKRKIIPIETINWIEADDYCVKVHTINNGTYTMRSTLKSLEEKLTTNFLRVHRKAIVNMKMAKELNLSNSPNLVLNNNAEIPVSKSNLKTVRNFLS